MAKFLNTANDEIIETEDADNEELFAKAEAKGFMPVADVTDTKTGQTHVIPRKELKQALDSGRFIIPQLYEAQQEEKRVKSEVSPIQAAGFGFAKAATMGAAPAVDGLEAMRKGGDYGTGRKQYEERQESAYEQYPTTYGLGYAAGVLPGLAAKGLSTAGQIGMGAIAPLVGQAAKVDEPVTQERALEMAGDVATGAALGGAGALASKKVPEVAEGLGAMAERRATKAIGADVLKPQRRIERMPGGRQAFGRELLDQGIVTAGKNVPQMRTKAEELAKVSGKAIGQTMSQFDTKIGAPSVNRQALLGEIEAIPVEIAQNPARAALAKRIESSFIEPMREWAKQGDAATLEEVWQIRSGLDELAYTPTGIDKPLNKELQRIRQIIEKRLHKSARDAGITDQELAAYDRAKRTYQVSKEAAQTTKEKMDRMQANRAVSLTDYLSGGSVGTAGAVVGGVPGGIAGSLIGAFGNKVARQRGPQAAAVALDKLSAMMKKDPERFKAIIETFVRTGATQIGDE